MKKIKKIFILFGFIFMILNLLAQGINMASMNENINYIKQEILLGKNIKNNGDLTGVSGLMVGDDGYLYLIAGTKDDDRIYNYIKDDTFESIKERRKYVSSKIIKLNTNGERILTIKRNIMGMAVDEDGNIFVVPDDDIIKGKTDKIVQYDKNGNEIKQFKISSIIKRGKISQKLLINNHGEILKKFDKKPLLKNLRKYKYSETKEKQEKIHNGEIRAKLIYEGIEELNKNRLNMEDVEWENRYKTLPIFLEIKDSKFVNINKEKIYVKLDIKGYLRPPTILSIDQNDNFFILIEKMDDNDTRYCPYIYIYI